MDGSVRQIAPLAPALHLGAARVLVIAVGQFTGQSMTPAAPRYPSLGQIAGHALSSVFLDNLGADLERLYAINRLAAAAESYGHVDARHIDVLVLAPSSDLGALAVRYAHRLPRGVHYLLRGLGSTRDRLQSPVVPALRSRILSRADSARLRRCNGAARRDRRVSRRRRGSIRAAVSARMALIAPVASSTLR